jgi:phage-related protein
LHSNKTSVSRKDAKTQRETNPLIQNNKIAKNYISSFADPQIQRGLFDSVKKAVTKGFDWVKEKVLEPIKRQAKALLDGIKAQAKSFLDKLKSGATSLLNKAKKAITTFINKIKSQINKLVQKAKKVATKIWQSIQKKAQGIAKRFQGIAKKTLQFARQQVQKFTQAYLKLAQKFVEIGNPQKAQDLIAKITQYTGKIIDGAKTKVMGLVRSATQTITGLLEKGTNQVKQVVGKATQGVQSLMNTITNGTQNLLNGVTKSIENIVNKTQDVFQIFNQGKEKLTGILGPAKKVAAWLIDQVMSTAQTLFNNVIKPLAQKVGQGIKTLLTPVVNVVTKTLRTATKALTKLTQSVVNSINKGLTWFIAHLKKIIELFLENVVKKGLDLATQIIKGITTGVIQAIEKIILEPLKAFMEFMQLINQVMASAGGVIDKILAHPVNFIKNLFAGVGQGLQSFVSRIGTHLQLGLQKFLLGPVAEMGLELPKSFDSTGLLSVVAQTSGLSYNKIRERASSKLGENKVAFIELGAEAAQSGNVTEFATQQLEGYVGNQAQALGEKSGILAEAMKLFGSLRQGAGGIFEYFKQLDFNSLIPMIMGEIKDYLIQEIIQKAVLQISAYLIPGAGWLKGAIDALRVMYAIFIKRAQQVKELVESFTGSVVDIAKGAIAGAAKKLEGGLGKTVPMLIGVLADYLGLGGIPQKIQSVFKKGQGWVDSKIMPIIDKILDKVAGIFNKIWGKISQATSKFTKGAQKFGNKLTTSLSKLFGFKTRFTTNRGESHSLYYENKGENPVLMIASNPQSIRDFLAFYANEYNVPNKEIQPIYDFITKNIEPLIKKLKQANTQQAEDKIQEQLLEQNVILSEKLKDLLKGDEKVGKIIDSYYLEGLTGTYSSMPKPKSDFFTADHQPQASILVWCAEQPFFGVKSNMAKRAAGRANQGYAINLYDNNTEYGRHGAGRTYKSKGDSTKDAFIQKVKSQIKGVQTNQEKRDITVDLLKNELRADVSTMEQVANKPNKDPVWSDIEALSISKTEKNKLIETIRNNILHGEKQLLSQDIDSLKY